ncbi:MAG TPA: ferritin-like domain-containing protein [Pyrinomonadaceae bacterium]|jgi:starvation-inducible DNA-binding protein
MVNADKRATGKIVSYTSTAARPAPAGLEGKVKQEIVEAVNRVIADGFALYEKTKIFYLNPAGSHKRDYKLLFDEQAEEIFASMDTLAEQVRQIGAAPLRSISHSGELQSVENYNGDLLSPGEMIAELIAGNQQIGASLRVAARICEKMREAPLGIILKDILDKTERRIRLLGEAEMKI